MAFKWSMAGLLVISLVPTVLYGYRHEGYDQQ
jgi:hypothetical protein